ncbi:hypothetical protein EDB85DRAFT_1900505, partial [Lactarius pseudohatsudake]
PRPAHQDEDEYESEDEEEEEEDEGEYEDVIEIEDEGEDELEDEDEDEIRDGDEERTSSRARMTWMRTKSRSTSTEGARKQCDRCIHAGVDCQPRPKGTCTRCNAKKLACSLMPKNPKTGKPDRRKLTAKQVFKFRLDQLKGKQPMCKPGEGSDSVTLASRMVGKMTLDSGSSHGHSRSAASRSAASHSPSIAESPIPPSTEPSPVPHSAAASRPPTPPAEPSVLAAAPLAPSPPAASIPIPDDIPAITPSLRRRLVPRPPDAVPDVLVRGLSGRSAPSQEQSSAAQASQVPSPGGSGMEALERRVAAIEEWIRAQDKNWKGSL